MLYDFGDNKGLVESRIHRNGGGVVAATALVEDTVFLDRSSVVFGHACIKDRVRVVGHCRISGDKLPGGVSTLIENDAFISGNVVIEGHVLMRDHAQARNFAKLSGSVAMMHHAKVADRVTIAGLVQMSDYAYAHEDVTVISEDDLITLNVRDLLNGNCILSSLKEVNSFLGKVARKRRGPKRQVSSDVAESADLAEEFDADDIAQVMPQQGLSIVCTDNLPLIRRMSAMPTLDELVRINMSRGGQSSRMGGINNAAADVKEERIAAAG